MNPRDTHSEIFDHALTSFLVDKGGRVVRIGNDLLCIRIAVRDLISHAHDGDQLVRLVGPDAWFQARSRRTASTDPCMEGLSSSTSATVSSLAGLRGP